MKKHNETKYHKDPKVKTYKIIAPNGDVLYLSYEEISDMFFYVRDDKEQSMQTIKWSNIKSFFYSAIGISEY